MDIVVAINDITVTGENLFFFDDSLVAVISDFSPRNSSVYGMYLSCAKNNMHLGSEVQVCTAL